MLNKERRMSQEPLNSIVSSLQDYNEYLGRLVSKLSSITDKLNKLEGMQQWSHKIKKTEERLSSIETEFTGFIDYFSSKKATPYSSSQPPITIRYKEWEDFKSQSTDANLVSFLFEEKERVFQVCALKEGKILAFSGDSPQLAKLLKSWLSKEVGTPQGKIVEGVLAIG